MKRQIIKIDHELCTGCGVCIPNCPEGALQVIDGKARLVSDLFCDGLGACIGTCPEGAITTEFREAEPYDERKVMKNIVAEGTNTLIAHLEHLMHHGEVDLLKQALSYLDDNTIKNPIPDKTKDFLDHSINIKGCALGEELDGLIGESDGSNSAHVHENSNAPAHNTHQTHKTNGEFDHKFGGCPSVQAIDLNPENSLKGESNDQDANEKGVAGDVHRPSFLRNWPVQINLLPLQAAYFKDADIIIAADCTSASYADFHRRFVKGRTLMIGCPKLDNAQHYIEKLAQIFKNNPIRSIHTLIMEVPCCSGMNYIVDKALELSGKKGIIPFSSNVVSIDGYIKS